MTQSHKESQLIELNDISKVLNKLSKELKGDMGLFYTAEEAIKVCLKSGKWDVKIPVKFLSSPMVLRE